MHPVGGRSTMVRDSNRRGRPPGGPLPGLGSGPAVKAEPGPSVVWGYEDLKARAGERAERLLGQGLSPGELVAVPEHPGPDLVLMQHALGLCQAALLPLRRGQAGESLGALIQATGAEWIWQGPGPRAGRLIATRCRTAAPSLGGHWASPLALVVETSGSSGVPRAVMLTAANLLDSASLVGRHLGLGPGDLWLGCLPMRHIGGLSIPYRCAGMGATLVLHPGFDAEAVSQDLGRYAITHLSLVPAMLARLLDLGRPPPPSLRVALVGGQSLGRSLAAQALDAGWPLYLSYGMTETASQIACSDRLEAPPVGGVVGRPLPGVEIDCVTCPAPPGSLRVRGPQVMAGYANPRRLPGQGLEDGWFRTSDLVCLDPVGILHCLGRADDALVSGGVKVHPARVEAALAEAPGLSEVAVVGVPDRVWGQRLVAIYTGAVSPAELDAWCRNRLPGAERPRRFIRRPRLPSLPSGKLDRHRLQELVAAQCADVNR